MLIIKYSYTSGSLSIRKLIWAAIMNIECCEGHSSIKGKYIESQSSSDKSLCGFVIIT